MTLTQFLDRLKELDEKATPRPWQTEGGLDQYVFSSNNEIMLAEMRGIGAGLTDEQRTQNAQLITELRNALPKLLAVIKEMREVLRWYAEGNTQNHEYTAKVDGDLIQQVKRIDLTHEFFTNHKSTDRVISEAEKPDFKVFFGKKARQALARCEQVIQEGMK